MATMHNAMHPYSITVGRNVLNAASLSMHFAVAHFAMSARTLCCRELHGSAPRRDGCDSEKVFGSMEAISSTRAT